MALFNSRRYFVLFAVLVHRVFTLFMLQLWQKPSLIQRTHRAPFFHANDNCFFRLPVTDVSDNAIWACNCVFHNARSAINRYVVFFHGWRLHVRCDSFLRSPDGKYLYFDYVFTAFAPSANGRLDGFFQRFCIFHIQFTTSGEVMKFSYSLSSYNIESC